MHRKSHSVYKSRPCSSRNFFQAAVQIIWIPIYWQALVLQITLFETIVSVWGFCAEYAILLDVFVEGFGILVVRAGYANFSSWTIVFAFLIVLLKLAYRFKILQHIDFVEIISCPCYMRAEGSRVFKQFTTTCCCWLCSTRVSWICKLSALFAVSSLTWFA